MSESWPFQPCQSDRHTPVARTAINKVVADWKRRGEPNYLTEITDEAAVSNIAVPGYSGSEEGGGEEANKSDPLYDEAVAVVLQSRKASNSSVKRKLHVGYNRAARLIEQMEASGVVSPMSSNGSREILASGGRE